MDCHCRLYFDTSDFYRAKQGLSGLKSLLQTLIYLRLAT
jgi:hypothetical protein